MSERHNEFPVVYLARHGETAWTITGQHTGLTDLPLTPVGEKNARKLGGALMGVRFARVFSSPLSRAWQTCELAGFRKSVEVLTDLVEWDYGQYEGRKSVEIHAECSNWDLFRDGCPGGESPEQVAARADRVLDLVRSVPGNVLLFSSGHFLRMLAARWTGIDRVGARSLMLSTGSLSVLGYEGTIARPAIRLWNDTHHLLDRQ
jgi:probable phosphoglycerate mutase